MKALILFAFAALSLGVGAANAKSYSAPAHNSYQNNWMSSGH
jgi:hypothetical protein